MGNLIAPEGFALDPCYPGGHLLRPEPMVERGTGRRREILGAHVETQADIDAKVWDLREEMAKNRETLP